MSSVAALAAPADLVRWEDRKVIITACFLVPGDPMPSARKRLDTRHNRLYTPTEETERVKVIQLCARASQPQIVSAGPARLRLRFFTRCVPWAMKRNDWDNLGKLMSDALNGITYTDDGQVVRGLVDKYQDKENPRTVVEVAEYLECL